jgi:hypothetical protein
MLFSITSYRKALRFRNIIFLLLAAFITLAGYKGYSSTMKIYAYHKAQAMISNDSLIEAEEWLRRASDNHTIHYFDEKTEQALADIEPITEMKNLIGAVDLQLEAAVNKDDFARLLEIEGQYRALQKKFSAKDASEKLLFSNTVAYYQTEDDLKGAFDHAQKRFIKEIKNEISKKSFPDLQAVTGMLQIPASYYNGVEAKVQELAALYEEYDQAKLEAWFTSKPFAEAVTEIVRLRAFYSDWMLADPWVPQFTDQYAEAALRAALDKGDLDAFLAGANAFQSAAKELAVSNSRTSAFISVSVQSQLAKAAGLKESKHYDAAVQMYKQLGIYRDTRKDILAVYTQWFENEPGELLKRGFKDIGSFSTATPLTEFAGSAIASAGLSDNRLLLSRLMPDEKLSVSQIGLDSGVTVQAIRAANAISVQNQPVILIEGVSTNRKARYMAYELRGTEFSKILDVEADGFEVNSTGVLLVSNTTMAEGTGQQSYFEYYNGKYTFSSVKPDYIEIRLADLPRYKNVKVRFTCDIMAADGNNAVVSYNGQYLLLSGNVTFRTGTAVVTGTWTGNEEIKKGSVSINGYVIQVSKVSQ